MFYEQKIQYKKSFGNLQSVKRLDEKLNIWSNVVKKKF
jgi:hypothetical protein